jgi:hypothetical protein
MWMEAGKNSSMSREGLTDAKDQVRQPRADAEAHIASS